MIKNILVIRNDRFGEFLLIIPALAAFKETFPGVKITLIVDPYVKELAGCVEYADEVIAWENKRHNFKEVLGFGVGLRKRRFDLAVVFNPSKEAHLISFLAGVPKRLGFSRKWGILLNVKMEDKKHLAEKHEVEYNLELAGLIGAKVGNKNLVLKVRASNLLDSFGDRSVVAIHPWTSDSVKQWPVERFVELAQRIVQKFDLGVVFVGRDKNRLGTTIEDRRIMDLTNKTSLVELAGVLKRCKLLVTSDSGPMHLAAAVATPVVALFRNDLPGKTARRWGPWGEGHSVIERSRLEDIDVDEVLEKIKNKLQR
jgi:ADP-heptose:LPS heptosyltransferase